MDTTLLEIAFVNDTMSRTKVIIIHPDHPPYTCYIEQLPVDKMPDDCVLNIIAQNYKGWVEGDH